MRSIVILAVLALAACGPPPAPTYPPQYELNFMRACQAQRGAIPARCTCIWNRIESEIDANDFAALERMPGPEREAHPLMQRILGFKQACAASVPAPGGEEAPTQP